MKENRTKIVKEVLGKKNKAGDIALLDSETHDRTIEVSKSVSIGIKQTDQCKRIEIPKLNSCV